MNPTDVITTEQQEETQPKPQTLKQSRWSEEYVKTGNKTKAALIAYYPEYPELLEIEYKDLNEEQRKVYEAAGSIGYQNFKKLQMSEVLEELGFTKKVVAGLISSRAIKATKKIIKRTKTIKHIKDGREISITTHEYEDVPDAQVQQRYLQMAQSAVNAGNDDDNKGKSGINVGEMNVQIINYGDKQEVVEVSSEGGDST